MKKHYVLLVAAVLLLGVAAWLMPSVNPAAGPSGASTAAAPSYPTGPTDADRAKIAARKTLPPAPTPTPAPGSAPSAAASPIVAAANRDAVMVALPPTAADVFVMEAQAFLARPAMRGIAQCLLAEGITFPVETLGLRTTDLDRVAIADLGDAGTLAVVSGDVGKLDVTRLIKNSVEERYGDHGRIFASAGVAPADLAKQWNVGRFQDSLVILGRPRAVVEQAIDRLEGRAPSQAMFPESEMYGDAYGRASWLSLRRILPADLSDKLEAAKALTAFHIKAGTDILISAEEHGEPDASQALGKATAAALVARRAAAAHEGDKVMVKLLDTFRVKLTPSGFKLQAGFTEAYLQQRLGTCIHGQ